MADSNNNTSTALANFLAFLQLVIQELWTLATARFATKSETSDLRRRMADLEDGNDPLVLSVDFETGMLVQTGTSSGTFGVDYTSGYLTFTPNPSS